MHLDSGAYQLGTGMVEITSIIAKLINQFFVAKDQKRIIAVCIIASVMGLGSLRTSISQGYETQIKLQGLNVCLT